MSHVSDRIVLNDAGTVKDIHPELAADFLCTQGRGRSCNINSPTCDSPSSCNMPCKEKTHARRSANAAVSCTMVPAGLVPATAPQQLISTDQHSERPMLTDE